MRMFAIRLFLFLLVAFAPLTATAIETPEGFLGSIYSQYKSEDGKQTPGIFLDNEQAIRAYFTPALADLMIADIQNAKKNGDVPSLDGDPFVGSQEWGIKDVNIQVVHAGSNHAQAQISFTSMGKDAKEQIALVMTNGGWRIDDIVWSGGTSLRGLYKKP